MLKKKKKKKQDENRNKGGTPKLKNSLIKWLALEQVCVSFIAVVG